MYLPENLKAKLRQIAAETGRTEAELIREGVQLAISQHLPPAPCFGVFQSGKSNLSERVDELLADFGTR